MDNLAVIREQLVLAIEFMEATDDGVVGHTPLWWAGNMPGFPEKYSPEDWREVNKPIHAVWEEYLSELMQAELGDYYLLARALPIGDLLAASKK